MTGSFRPIDIDDWTASAYRNSLEVLINAIRGRKFAEVRKILAGSSADVNGRTSDGWTPLQLAIKYGAYDIIPDLFASGARWPRVKVLPSYQQTTCTCIGPWPLEEQVDKLADLFEELLLAYYQLALPEHEDSDVNVTAGDNS